MDILRLIALSAIVLRTIEGIMETFWISKYNNANTIRRKEAGACSKAIYIFPLLNAVMPAIRCQ